MLEVKDLRRKQAGGMEQEVMEADWQEDRSGRGDLVEAGVTWRQAWETGTQSGDLACDLRVLCLSL